MSRAAVDRGERAYRALVGERVIPRGEVRRPSGEGRRFLRNEFACTEAAGDLKSEWVVRSRG
jgi:hypothetical protein